MKKLVARLWAWTWEPETDQQRATRAMWNNILESILTVIGNVLVFCFFILFIFLILSWVF